MLVFVSERGGILKSLHDHPGQWDCTAMMKVTPGRLWRPTVRQDVKQYIKTCDTCQKIKPVPRYMFVLGGTVTVLFEVYLIDFAGPFQKAVSLWSAVLTCMHRTFDCKAGGTSNDRRNGKRRSCT